MFERCPRNGHQSIDGNGINSQFSQTDSHVEAVFPGLSHADDTSGTGTHAFCFYFFQSLDFHVIGMGGADIREISPGGLDVMVIAGYACFVETMQLFSREKSHGSTKVNLTFPVHGLICVDGFIKFFSSQCFSGGDNGEAVHTFRFIEFAELHDFFFRQKIVDFTVGMMMCGLGTVFAVFRAASASSVDDGTKIHLITDARFADLVCSFTKIVKIAGKEEGKIIFSG